MRLSSVPFLQLAVVLWSSLLSANAHQCNEFYNRVEDYSYVKTECDRLNCSENVIKLANEMIRRGVDENEIKFLMIETKDPNHYLIPQAELFIQDSGWPFHVVVQREDKIFDIDHFMKGGKPIPVAEYFKDMFGKGNVSFEAIDVLPIPYSDYIAMEKRYGQLAHLYNLYRSPVQRRELSKYLAGFGVHFRDVQIVWIQNWDKEYTPQSELLIAAHRERLKEIPLDSLIHFIAEKPPIRLQRRVYSGRLIGVARNYLTLRADDGTVQDIFFETIQYDSIYRH